MNGGKRITYGHCLGWFKKKKKNMNFLYSKKTKSELLHSLTTAPIRTNPDYDQPFEIHADASKIAFGAVLVQILDGEERD